ncbi:unnamed protein product [Moneuplotes crassus]|uniref:Uncharacterized protein n=1 Tax=Euplotes crassus TaxID=5936 RepID=A0AAD2D280_EUPCR|nr:unnamed protein product [Moneuplotes crassus]
MGTGVKKLLSYRMNPILEYCCGIISKKILSLVSCLVLNHQISGWIKLKNSGRPTTSIVMPIPLLCAQIVKFRILKSLCKFLLQKQVIYCKM